MKKSTIIILAVLLTALIQPSFGRNVNDSTTKEKPFIITTLVIDANVNVILVNKDDAALEANGNKAFRKLIRLWKDGDTLTIHSNEKGAFVEGTIYVPANHLRKIHVNSNANVKSLFALQSPNLSVVINGECQLALSNIGEVSVNAADGYSYQEDRYSRKLPVSLSNRK